MCECGVSYVISRYVVRVVQVRAVGVVQVEVVVAAQHLAHAAGPLGAVERPLVERRGARRAPQPALARQLAPRARPLRLHVARRVRARVRRRLQLHAPRLSILHNTC